MEVAARNDHPTSTPLSSKSEWTDDKNTYSSLPKVRLPALWCVWKWNINCRCSKAPSVLQKRKRLQMPPGSDALHQHLLRVAYQSGHVWGNMLINTTEPVPVIGWGWDSEALDLPPIPVYRTIPVLSKKIPELVSCQCKSPCKAPCSCCTHGQPCMLLCKCKCLSEIWIMSPFVLNSFATKV